MPSPQISALQSARQPSPGTLLPSSQASPGSSNPSPQPGRGSEFASASDQVFLIGFYVVMWLVLVPFLSTAVKRLRVEHILLVLFIPPSLKYIRYFVDVELCLLFVIYGGELVRVARAPLGRVAGYWRGVALSGLERWAKQETQSGEAATAPDSGRRRSLLPIIASLYALLLVALGVVSYGHHVELRRFHQQLEHGQHLILVDADELEPLKEALHDCPVLDSGSDDTLIRPFDEEPDSRQTVENAA